MNLDLFTIIAQIINFIILILLLRHFLYKRIIEVMDRRAKKIRSEIEEAEEKRRKAEQAEKEYLEKKEELESKSEELTKKAEKEAEEKRKRLLEEARQDAEANREKMWEGIRKQKSEFLHELRIRAAEGVFDISGRALKELSDSRLESLIVRKLFGRLESSEEESAADIGEIKGSDREIKIISGSELSEDAKEEVRQNMRERFSSDVFLEFETSEDLVGGIEMIIGEKKYEWNLKDYLDDLEQKTVKTFEKL